MWPIIFKYQRYLLSVVLPKRPQGYKQRFVIPYQQKNRFYLGGLYSDCFSDRSKYAYIRGGGGGGALII